MPNLRHAFPAAILLGVLAPVAATAEAWHGQIQCDVIPGLNTKPLFGDFVMHSNGTRLTYSRPVHNADSASLSGVAEAGAGTLLGEEIKLHGGAAGVGYSYTATYQGRTDGSQANLGGEQVWTATRLPRPFHRACHITLTR